MIFSKIAVNSEGCTDAWQKRVDGVPMSPPRHRSQTSSSYIPSIGRRYREELDRTTHLKKDRPTPSCTWAASRTGSRFPPTARQNTGCTDACERLGDVTTQNTG